MDRYSPREGLFFFPGEVMSMAKERQADTGQAVEAEVVEPVPRAWEERPELRGNPHGYPEEVRAELLRRVLENGEHVARVAREMGINRNALHAWLAELKEEKRVQVEIENIELRDLLTRKAKEFILAVNKDKLAKAGVKDLLIAAGIALDHRRELAGPARGASFSRLRIAWKSGEGAVEVETGS